MELNMKKISIVLISLLSSLIMGQKEIPGSGSISGTLLDERMNGSQDLVIDPEMVQQVRMIKVNKEKAFMKKQILNGQKADLKTFKVAEEESKFLAIKEVIDQKKKSIQDNIEIKNNNKELNEINFEKIEVKLPGSHK
jgi:hypothetical protein